MKAGRPREGQGGWCRLKDREAEMATEVEGEPRPGWVGVSTAMRTMRGRDAAPDGATERARMRGRREKEGSCTAAGAAGEMSWAIGNY